MTKPKNALQTPISVLIERLQKLPAGSTYEITDSELHGGQTGNLGTSYEETIHIVEGRQHDTHHKIKLKYTETIAKRFEEIMMNHAHARYGYEKGEQVEMSETDCIKLALITVVDNIL